MTTMCKKKVLTGVLATASLGLLIVAGMAFGYDQYSVSKDATNCRRCHGDFRNNPYVEPDTMVSWGDDAHDIHRNTMLSGDCETCHSAGPRFPVLLNSSAGGVSLPAIACTGCHGRAADGTGSGTEGYGAGLRQHHWNINVSIAGTTTRICGTCHMRSDLGGLTDADPNNFTPVGEDVLPPYYSDTLHPDIPQDPCSDPTSGLNGENFAGSAYGLNNDGDAARDTNDADCGAVVSAPGEVSGPALPLMTVTAQAGTTLTVSYGSPCDASGQAFVYGPLSAVASYGYSGADCAIGDTGSYVFDFSGEPGDLIFLVVGDNGTSEGSYGTDWTGAERPSDDLLLPPVCAVPQDLPNRCD